MQHLIRQPSAATFPHWGRLKERITSLPQRWRLIVVPPLLVGVGVLDDPLLINYILKDDVFYIMHHKTYILSLRLTVLNNTSVAFGDNVFAQRAPLTHIQKAAQTSYKNDICALCKI